MPFNQKHLEILKAILNEGGNSLLGQHPVGYTPKDGVMYACLDAPVRFSHEKLDRAALRRTWTQKPFDAEVAYVSTMAWGGMNRNNLQQSLADKSSKTLLRLVEEIGTGECNRYTAYELFLRARHKHKIKGIGISYFTKLIAFANDCKDSFILDQWTAKSINLLCGSLIPMSGDYPHPTKCTPDIYQNFCIAVENLARELQITPEEAEILIFSHGGRYKGAWRQYVINHLTPVQNTEDVNDQIPEYDANDPVVSDQVNISAEALHRILEKLSDNIELNPASVCYNAGTDKTLKINGIHCRYSIRVNVGLALLLPNGPETEEEWHEMANNYGLCLNRSYHNHNYYCGFLRITPKIVEEHWTSIETWFREFAVIEDTPESKA